LFGKLVQRLQEHIKHYEALQSQYEAMAIYETQMVMACNCISAPYQHHISTISDNISDNIYQTTYQTTYMVKYGEIW